MKTHHQGEVVQVGDMFGFGISISLLNQNVVYSGSCVPWSMVCSCQFLGPGVEGHQGVILQHLLKSGTIRMTRASATSNRGGKVAEADTQCLVFQAGVEITSQDPTISTWKHLKLLIQFIPKLLAEKPTVRVGLIEGILVQV